MDIKDILSVGLTAEDFDTCIKGLDAIPEKAKAEEGLHGVLNMLMGSMMNNQGRKEMELRFKKRMEDLEKKCANEKEDLVILKSKLILLKRLLLSNEAVKMANDILHSPPPILQMINLQQAA